MELYKNSCTAESYLEQKHKIIFRSLYLSFQCLSLASFLCLSSTFMCYTMPLPAKYTPTLCTYWSKYIWFVLHCLLGSNLFHKALFIVWHMIQNRATNWICLYQLAGPWLWRHPYMWSVTTHKQITTHMSAMKDTYCVFETNILCVTCILYKFTQCKHIAACKNIQISLAPWCDCIN